MTATAAPRTAAPAPVGPADDEKLVDEVASPSHDDRGPQSAPGLDRVILWCVDVVREHPYFLGVPTTIFLFVKVIRVSRANEDTALALLGAADVATITVGGALSLLYTVTLIGIVSGLCVVGRRHSVLNGHLVASMGVLAVALTAGLLLLPLPVVGVVCALALGWRALDWVSRRLPYPNHEAGLGTRLGRIAVVGVTAGCAAMTLWALIDERPWVPPAIVQTTDGPIVGYIVGDGNWVTVLTEDDRTIHWIRSEDVEGRQLCDLEQSPATRTLPQILSSDTGGGRYPPCK